MKFGIYFVTIFYALSGAAFAETGAGPKANQDQQMEAWTKASTPGDEHKLLQRFVGRWNHIVKWWVKPEGEPEISSGTSEVESIFGGRFIRHQVRGTSMGQPFEGLGITGYDNIQKYFSSVWIDNMGTGMMVGKGELDKSKNVIVDRGSFSCPMSSSGTRTYRAIWTLPEWDSFKYEMFSPGDDGKEFRMMEIVYTKAQ